MPSPKPRRNYRAVIESLRQVWRIETLRDDEAIWTFGAAALKRFEADRPLRLCVWNMCKGAGGLLFEHDFRVLMYSADLVLTQEALISERSLRTYSLPGFQAIHGASYRRLDGLRDGVMTLTRANAGSHMQRIVCKYPEPIFKTPKAALVSFFDWAGIDRPVMVVNIHATLVRSKRGAMDEIGHLVEHLPDHDGPIILAGDFNTFTRGYLEGVAQVLGGLGLHLIKIGDDPRSRTSALDQIFVRGLKVRWLTVDTTIKNSDHFPLIAELDPS